MRRKPATVGAMCTSQRPGGSGAPAAAAVGAIGTTVCSRGRTRPSSEICSFASVRAGSRYSLSSSTLRRKTAAVERRSSPVTSRSSRGT